MNKRVPLLLSLLGVILLAASLAYWILQLYQPPQRPIAAAPQVQVADPPIDAAATLFGGQVAVASATNYQLTGIVSAGRDSVAIIVADNAPPKALKVGKEVAPGVSLAEVNTRYVMLSDNGVMKRVDLPPDTKGGATIGGAAGAPIGAQDGAAPLSPAMVAPAGNAVAEPPMAPGSVAQQMPASNPGDVGTHDTPPQNPNAAPVGNTPNAAPNQQPNTGNPAPPPVQMAPPTRAVGVPNNPSPAAQ